MLRSKSRAARRRKLRKLGGRLELPSNVATKELGPFPRYPPESWVIIIYWFPYPILLNLQNLSKSIKIFQFSNLQIFKSSNLQTFNLQCSSSSSPSHTFAPLPFSSFCFLRIIAVIYLYRIFFFFGLFKVLNLHNYIFFLFSFSFPILLPQKHLFYSCRSYHVLFSYFRIYFTLISLMSFRISLFRLTFTDYLSCFR